MLKRCLSDPCGLAETGQVVIPRLHQDFTTPGSRTKFLLEHGPNVCGQGEPCRWNADVTTKNDALHAAEEEEIWNSTDLNPQAKRLIVDLMHGKNRLTKASNDLQMALNACEDSRIDLEYENTSLKNQIKSMQLAIHRSEKLRLEMDEIQAALATSQKTSHCLRASNNQLEKEIKTLSHQIEAAAHEMSDIMHEREMDKKKMASLTQHVRALEKQLEKARTTLDEKDATIQMRDVVIYQQKASMEELTAIRQDLREKVKDLEGQLELAVLHEGGSFLHSDGTLSLATKTYLSLAEELILMDKFKQEESDDDDIPMSSELKGEVEEDGSYEEMNTSLVEAIGESVLELNKHKDLVELTRNEEVMKIVICAPKGEEIEFLETAEHENITLQEAVNDTVQFEEEKAAKPEKLEVEFGDLIKVPEETKTASGHQEAEHMHLEIDVTKPEEEKLAVAPSEVVKEYAVKGTVQFEDIEQTISYKEVKQAFVHEGVQFATGYQEDTKVEVEFQCEEQKWAGTHLEEVLKHTEQIKEGILVVDVQDMPRGHQDQSMEVEQAQLSVLDEESALQRNRNCLDTSDKIKRGALIAGAIGLGVFLLWKIKP